LQSYQNALTKQEELYVVLSTEIKRIKLGGRKRKKLVLVCKINTQEKNSKDYLVLKKLKYS